jgi:DNA polymerase sigma
MYGGRHRQESSTQELIVSVIQNALISEPECCNVEGVPNARTPIVKFFHKPTGIPCDVAFRHGLGCENTKLIKYDAVPYFSKYSQLSIIQGNVGGGRVMDNQNPQLK